MTRHRRPPVVIAVAAAVAVLFFALPLVALARAAAWSDLLADLTTPQARDALVLSLVCSLSATALSVVLGLPLAWMLAREWVPLRPLVRGLTTVPLVLPPVVGGVALLRAFGGRSPVGQALADWFGIRLTFTTAGAVLAATFVAMPFLVITVEGALRSTDPRLEEVAATLGAGRWRVMRTIVLPQIAPSLLAGAVLCWARALGEFGATLTFAGNVQGRTQTLPLAVYLLLDSSPATAIGLSLVLLAVSLVVIVSLRHRLLAGLT